MKPSLRPPTPLTKSQQAHLDAMGDEPWHYIGRGEWTQNGEPIAQDGKNWLNSHQIAALWRRGWVEKMPGTARRVCRQKVPGIPEGVSR